MNSASDAHGAVKGEVGPEPDQLAIDATAMRTSPFTPSTQFLIGWITKDIHGHSGMASPIGTTDGASNPD